MAKRMNGLRVISAPSGDTECWLFDTVKRQAEEAGIGMPEIAILDSGQPNAFATGASRNNALVAVNIQVLEVMYAEQVKAVVGHEISHVANGDMIRLALIQGVVNTFVILFSRIVGHVVDRMILKNQRGPGIGFWITTFVAEMVLGLIASIIVMWFSRQREFRANQSGAALAGRAAMTGALQRLGSYASAVNLPDQLAAFGISGKFSGDLTRLLTTHPPLEERISRLTEGGQNDTDSKAAHAPADRSDHPFN
jgi:heat shock protein HtpX